MMSVRNRLPTADEALPGRVETMQIPESHFVNGHPLESPYPPGCERALFGLGCFWGAERTFWQLPGVYVTAVGYAGGFTPNPTYQEVCSGLTGHNEVVRVVHDPGLIGYGQLLKVFWEAHNPTQGMRQGNDVGTQYRSGIYCYSAAQKELARRAHAGYRQALDRAGYGPVTTEILDAPIFYFAEVYHQQYLAKNPGGYCGLGGTGVVCRPQAGGSVSC